MASVLPILWACTAPRLPDPVVDAVEPSFAFNGEDVPITIVGSNFLPQVSIDAVSGRSDVDADYRGWLVGPEGTSFRNELLGVGIIDDQHLSATVASGLAPGAYGLQVEGPTGVKAQLPGSFLVTDAEAAQLVLDSDRQVYSVTELAPIEIRLVDVDQRPVAIDFEIAVSAAPGTVEFQNGSDGDGLVDAGPTPDGDGLRGFLSDGTATVLLRPALPGNLEVTVAPWRDEDTNVVGDSYQLVFEPGDNLHVEFTLPPAAYGQLPELVAGVATELQARIVDQYGNTVTNPYFVTLSADCTGWSSSLTLEGSTAFDIVPRFATVTSGCEEDRILVVAGGLAGSSDPFEVVAGPTHHFAVNPWQSARRAGDTLDMFVTPEDVFGNLSEWSGSITLDDIPHGIVGTSCFSVVGLTNVCSAMVTLAHPANIISATGDDGTVGYSAPIVVSPDDVATSATIGVTGPLVAGDEAQVDVRAFDAWGNAMDTSLFAAGDIVVQDELGEADCAPLAFLPDGTAQFGCTLYTARPSAVLTADLPAFGVSADAAPVRVDNGPLEVVGFTGEGPIVAGDDLTLNLFAEDAYGNRYLVQTDPVVDLTDDTGTFSVPSVTFGADATAVVVGSFTMAGTTAIHASQGGLALGSSDPILVMPGPTTGLELTLLVPWAWEGTPADVQVETVDAFGNRTDTTGSATLTSRTTASSPVVVPLVNGVGAAPFTWSSTAFVDVLDGDMSGFTGSSDVVVVRDCSGSGPTADLTFGGFADAIACLDAATGTATVLADLSGSTAGAAPVTGYAAAREGGPTVADVQPALSLELPGTGAFALFGLAVGSDGCGAEVLATGWAGPDDDSPVGPIVLSTTAIDVSTDTAVGAGVPVDVVGVVDCSRDPAAAQEIHLRTTAGTLGGAVASGSGPVLVLDAAGDGTVTIDTDGELSNGTVQVHAWVDSGAAGGLLSLPITGDAIHPIVIDQDPAGVVAAAVSSITLTFSEPMFANSVSNTANFTISGPSPVTVVSAVPSGNATTLTFDVPADPSLGLWTVTAATQVRDVAGNRIAGDWTGLTASYVGAFGGFGSPPEALSCTAFDPAGLTIRPDGDPGVDGEADAFTVSVSSPVAPAWWVIEVTDGSGVLVHEDWDVPIGPTDTVSWAGRGLDGVVVSNGGYTVDVRPDDGLGNRGAGCAVTVIVDNHLGAAP